MAKYLQVDQDPLGHTVGSRRSKVILALFLLLVFIAIKCISINNAFPFEMMQIYSKPKMPDKVQDNNDGSFGGNFGMRNNYNEPNRESRSNFYQPPPRQPGPQMMRSTTPQTPVMLPAVGMMPPMSSTTSTTTTTMRPTTPKRRRIKLATRRTMTSTTTTQSSNMEDMNKIEDKPVTESPKNTEMKKNGDKKVDEKKKDDKKKNEKKKEDKKKENGKKKKEEKVEVEEVEKYIPKVMKVTNYDEKKKKWSPLVKESEVIVETVLGKVSGIRGKALDKEVNAFLGIPFAEPPVGNLRFRRTVPVKPWTGVLNATSFKPHCLQHFDADITLARTFTTLNMSEDCLYLNIWTPTIKPAKLKSVMIWIYGGGFKSGSANYDETDGRVLATLGDVVVVTFNYRVGALGFMDQETNDLPGNQGLYDAVQAISWVRENIKNFGGDKNEVTLFGHYSGAVMIGLFMVSETTKYWFKRAILQSGSPLFQDFFDGKNSRTSDLFIEAINCGNEMDKKMEKKCLQNKTMEEILDVQKTLLKRDHNMFAPTHCEELIPTTIMDAIRSSTYGSDPGYNEYFDGIESVLMGSNRDELSVSLFMEFPEMFSIKRVELNLTTLTELRELVDKVFTNMTKGDDKFVKFVTETFFTNGPEEDSTDNLVQKMYRVFGDAAVACPVSIFGRELQKMGKKVFMYEFNQRAQNTPWGDWMGVAFSTEIPYIFGHPLRYPRVYSKDDLVISRRMIQAWSLFAKAGKVPTQKNVTWEPLTDELQEYIEINPRSAELSSRDNNEVCNLLKFTIHQTNSSDLNCTTRTQFSDEVEIKITDDEDMEATTELEMTTEEPTEPPILACPLFTIEDPREPAVDYTNYEVIDLTIVAITNTSAVFHCDEGEEIVGEQVSICTEDGTWTSPKPTCKKKTYPKGVVVSSELPKFFCELFHLPEDSDYGPLVAYDNLLLVNDTLTFAVKGTTARFWCRTKDNEVIKLFGTPVITCGKYGIWDSIEPLCRVVDETKEIKIIEKDVKNQLVIVGLILIVVLAVLYVTFTLYIKFDVDKRNSSSAIKLERMSRDSDEQTNTDYFYHNQGRASTDHSSNYSPDVDINQREEEVLLGVEFSGSEISPEDMEIIDILAKARDDSASLISRTPSKQLDDNMNVVAASRRSVRSYRSSGLSSTSTRSTVISSTSGHSSSRHVKTVTRNYRSRNNSNRTSRNSSSRNESVGSSSSEPETVLWVYK